MPLPGHQFPPSYQIMGTHKDLITLWIANTNILGQYSQYPKAEFHPRWREAQRSEWGCGLVLCPDRPSHKEMVWWPSSNFLVVQSQQTLIISLHDVGSISLAYTHAWMMWYYFIGLSKSRLLILHNQEMSSSTPTTTGVWKHAPLKISKYEVISEAIWWLLSQAGGEL